MIGDCQVYVEPCDAEDHKHIADYNAGRMIPLVVPLKLNWRNDSLIRVAAQVLSKNHIPKELCEMVFLDLAKSLDRSDGRREVTLFNHRWCPWDQVDAVYRPVDVGTYMPELALCPVPAPGTPEPEELLQQPAPWPPNHGSLAVLARAWDVQNQLDAATSEAAVRILVENYERNPIKVNRDFEDIPIEVGEFRILPLSIAPKQDASGWRPTHVVCYVPAPPEDIDIEIACASTELGRAADEENHDWDAGYDDYDFPYCIQYYNRS